VTNMSTLSAIVKALDVKRVVWIDDMFSTVASSTAIDFVDLARKAAEQNLFATIGRPDLADEEDPIAALSAEFGQNLALASRVTALLGPDTLREQAEGMLSGLQCETEQKTGLEWQTILEGHLPAYQKTLFLVDRDFKDEGIDDDGSDAILKKTVSSFILDKPTNYCVVVTKEVTADSEVSERYKFLKQVLGADVDDENLTRFSVISKNAFSDHAEEILSKSLRDKLAGVVLFTMLKHMESSLGKSVETLRGILATEFPNINQAVLHNSYKEGASELDVLLRILQQKHRIELATSLHTGADDTLRQLLGRFRLFQLDAEAEDVTEHEISGELSTLCRAEVITPGPLINETMLPVVPGDVFVATDSKLPSKDEMKEWSSDLQTGKTYYMLLGQLCDIVPRGDTGHWATNMAFLARFEVKPVNKHDSGIPKNQIHSGRIGWMVVGDLALHFDYRNVLAANVSALQLCAFNKQGGAFLHEADRPEDVWSLASVARAKKNALDAFKGKSIPPELEYYALGFEGDDQARKLKVFKRKRKRIFFYPVRRVCRIREIEAGEALGALERYWRRPAKPHYFAN
jgi:hypothetical protein